MKKLLSLLALIFNKTGPISIQSKPLYIGKYKLVKYIDVNQPDKKYLTGIYKYKSKKVFIKTWLGTWKNFDYFALENEQVATEILGKYVSKLKLNNSLHIPRIIESYKTRNQLSIIYEYVDGKLLEEFPAVKQAKIINDVYDAFIKISKNMLSKDKYKFTRRSILWHVGIFIPKLLRSKLPLTSKTVLLTKVFTSLGHMQNVKKSNFVMAHGDLLPKNILMKKNKIYVVDYGHTSFATPGYDMLYLSTQPNISNLLNLLLPQGLFTTNHYMGKLIAAISAVSTDNLTLQKYFIDFVCA